MSKNNKNKNKVGAGNPVPDPAVADIKEEVVTEDVFYGTDEGIEPKDEEKVEKESDESKEKDEAKENSEKDKAPDSGAKVEEKKENKIDLESIKTLAIEKGLLELTVVQLKALASGLNIPIRTGVTKKEDLASAIVGYKNMASSFVLGTPIGYATPRLGVLGFKANVSYPIDKEREKLFIKSKVI